MKTIQLQPKAMQGRPSLPPDLEVPEQKHRRKYTAAYKLRILKEYDVCTVSGEVGALAPGRPLSF